MSEPRCILCGKKYNAEVLYNGALFFVAHYCCWDYGDGLDQSYDFSYEGSCHKTKRAAYEAIPDNLVQKEE